MARRKSVPRKTPPRSRRVEPWLRRLGVAVRYAVIGAIWSAIGLGAALLYLTWDMPNPVHAVTTPRLPAIRLYDQSGHLVARFGDVAGGVVLPRELPAYVPGAFIAIEDRRFYQDGAFDLKGIARAGLLDMGRGRIVQGGSTLTQQVAKTLFLTDQRSLRRKIQEAILSLWLARHYTKQEILGIYLNRVYLGEGAYGVDAASRLYFGVPAAQLTLAQAAILAGLPQAPSSLNPLADPRAAANRARDVLNAMVATQRISLAEENSAEQQLDQEAVPRLRGSWFALWVMQQDSGAMPEGQDVSLTTTLDPGLQHVAETALASALAEHGAALCIGQGAVVVLDARTGAVRALVGGVGDRDGYDRAVLARRQTGSAIKPIVWLAGLLAGMSPDDKVLDAPLYFRGYHPQDDERVYHGDVTMTEALADSMNTVAIRILLRAGGPRRVIALARTLGLDDHFPDDATMALGTGGVGVMQLAGAYATFFNGGQRVTPYGVTGINGIPYAAPPAVPVVAPALAGEVAAMMHAVVLNGTGTGAFVPGLYTAGKTGTTQDYRDAWFVGDAGPDIIAVWVGNDNDTPMRHVYGGTIPAAVFRAIAASLPH